jgi:predicted nucleic acid-binding protein
VILLDTNVVSEIMKRAPDPAVARFIAATPISDLFIPSLVVAEIRYGLGRLPDGRRRTSMADSFDALLATGFADRVLVFDARCAEAYARGRVARDQAGRPVHVHDALIGGMAMAYGGKIATRNTTDFDDYGLVVINPWVVL